MPPQKTLCALFNNMYTTPHLKKDLQPIRFVTARSMFFQECAVARVCIIDLRKTHHGSTYEKLELILQREPMKHRNIGQNCLLFR